MSIGYKEFGVRRSVTPTVRSGNRSGLRVAPEVSELSRQDGIRVDGFDVPAIRTRRAETTVELGSGQSFAIAGLLNKPTQQDISKLPGLGDLPVLGTLFRSTNLPRCEPVLVLIVPPSLVHPTPEPERASPTAGRT